MRGLNKSIVPVYEQAYQHKLVGQAGYISNMDILIAAVRFVTIYGSMLGTTSEDDSYTMASYSDIYRSACRVIPNIHTQIQNIIAAIKPHPPSRFIQSARKEFVTASEVLEYPIRRNEQTDVISQKKYIHIRLSELISPIIAPRKTKSKKKP